MNPAHAQLRLYSLYGAAFGLCFPLFSTPFYAWNEGIGLWEAQASQPLLWVINTAPVFLGLFAALGGWRQDAVQALNRALSDQMAVSERARQAAVEAEERALAASAAKSEFLANMSHELRTPLNAVIGYGEMLIEGAEDDGRTQDVADLVRIRDAGKHLLKLINDILDLSRIEAGRMSLFVEDCEVRPLVEEVVDTLQGTASQRGNKLVVELPEATTLVVGDELRVRQVLLNLIGNALKFTEAGEVRVSVRSVLDHREKAWVCFAVRDSGIGMTDEQITRIFQPFIQAEAGTTRRFGGTGLGLTLTQRFCHAMGGRIEVESQLGAGSTFTVWLPGRGGHEAGPMSTPLPSSAGTGRTVLVIDDDADVRTLLGRTLEQAGYTVLQAAGGEEGVKLALRHRPDAITLDVMMPEEDGWSVLSRLKASSETSEIPVVMVTMVDERSRGYALGAREYLVKPVERMRLLQLLSQFGANGVGQVLVVDDDPGVRDLVSRSLRAAGWTTMEAENGRRALAALERFRPDVILLDLMMPEMDGFSFLHELRQDPLWARVPVIVLTARTLSPEEHTTLRASVSKIIEKGAFSKDALLDEVRGVLKAAVRPPA